jgi:XTP/dITP diphosphohydrolase
VPRLLIATSNAGKVSEFQGLLVGCGWEVVAPADIGLNLEVDETGLSYAENARIKAEAFAQASGMAALADDSGLEVDALNGEPGALHHVHGWDGQDPAERIEILRDALKDVPPARRTARFRAVIVVVMPDGRSVQEEGACEGLIADMPRGEGGFGYDPVFLLPDGRTMAELSEAEKNRVSHRAVAAAKVREWLRSQLPAGEMYPERRNG